MLALPWPFAFRAKNRAASVVSCMMLHGFYAALQHTYAHIWVRLKTKQWGYADLSLVSSCQGASLVCFLLEPQPHVKLAGPAPLPVFAL